MKRPEKMIGDLNKCTKGDRLLSSLGLVLTYVRKCTEGEYGDHVVKYPDGSQGMRFNDGYVYQFNRLPNYDHDIIEVLG